MGVCVNAEFTSQRPHWDADTGLLGKKGSPVVRNHVVLAATPVALEKSQVPSRRGRALVC